MSQIFAIDESVVGVMNFPNGKEQAQVFKYEDHEYIENFFNAYNPANAKEAHHNPLRGKEQVQQAFSQHKAINTMKGEIVDFSVIPSTMTIMALDSLTSEESNALAEKHSNLLESKTHQPTKAEIHDLKQL